MTQKEIGKGIIEIDDVIDLIDDGHHDKDVFNLIKISNELFSKLTLDNKKKCLEYFSRKLEKNIEEFGA